MKKSSAVLSVLAALALGFGGGYYVRGTSVPDLTMAPAQTQQAASRYATAGLSSDFTPLPTPKPAPTPTPFTVRLPQHTSAPRPASTPSTYIVNKKSRVFHLTTCSYAQNIKKENRIKWMDVHREELMESGYQRCTHCKP